MLEIVFSESVEGCFRYAQHCGEGPFKGVVGVFIAPEDGQRPSEEEFEQARKKAEAKAREKWERSVPLGGDAGDVLCFAGGYSVGDISGDGLSQARVDSVSELFSIFPEALPDMLRIIDDSIKNFQTLTERVTQGETLRIWYSDQPDEMCGLCWFLAQVLERMKTLPPMQTVKLPNLVRRGDVLVSYQGWGQVEPGELHSFLRLSEDVIPAFATAASIRWRELQKQNSPLRAVVNGALRGVSEDFYDHEIEAELSKMGDEFHEAHLIGNVLGRQLGIGDAWVALRVEKMIRDGRLAPLTRPEPGEIIYRRMLKKVPERLRT